MSKLLCGTLAIVLATAGFAAPKDPATESQTAGKHQGKHHKEKHGKSTGKSGKTGSAPQTDGQPVVK